MTDDGRLCVFPDHWHASLRCVWAGTTCSRLHTIPHAIATSNALCYTHPPPTSPDMGLRAPRLIFLVVFLVNCILWSNSRYAQVSTPYQSSKLALAKRSISSDGQLTALLNSSELEDDDQVRLSVLHRCQWHNLIIFTVSSLLCTP